MFIFGIFRKAHGKITITHNPRIQKSSLLIFPYVVFSLLSIGIFIYQYIDLAFIKCDSA